VNVVLDTNVLVSGLMTRAGTCSIILDLLADDRLTVVLDGRIMDEYERVCAKPQLGLDSRAVGDFLHFLNNFAVNIAATPLRADMPDPDDLPFLEVATEGSAVLVTGNKKHFPEKVIANVPVVSPREFLELFALANNSG